MHNRPHEKTQSLHFSSVLKACVCVAACASLLTPVQELHTQLIKLGVYSDVYVGTTLVDSYSKSCGGIEIARKVFEEMPERNLISWTSLISGYAQNGYFNEALSVFERMHAAGMRPNEIILAVFCQLVIIWVHQGWGEGYMDSRRIIVMTWICLGVDMYSNCGLVENAFRVFQRMPQLNVVACSAMIVGLAMNGRAMEAIEIF